MKTEKGTAVLVICMH